jgi:hypothetical protein
MVLQYLQLYYSDSVTTVNLGNSYASYIVSKMLTRVGK